MVLSMSDTEILKMIFIGVFIMGVLTLFRVKYLLRKYYSAQHDEIFGSSLLEYSASNSLKVVRFSLLKREWEFVKNDKLLFWLRIYRIISIIFYSIIFLAIMYMVVVVVTEIYKSQ